MTKPGDITSKNTKAEILDAFEEMKLKFKQSEKQKLNSSQNEIKQKEDNKTIEKSKTYTPNNLENEIILLRKRIQNSLDNTMNKLNEESGKLQTLRKAIYIENKKLEEIYNIQLAADSLKILISDYEAKQKEFSYNKAKQEKQFEEESSQKRKNWEREQEEYKYNLTLEREREQETYETEQARKESEWEKKTTKKETEINEREQKLATQEQEIIEMRAKIERFPKKLESIIHETKRRKEKQLRVEFRHEKELLEQKWVAQKGVLEVKINNLESIIEGHTTNINSLKNALTEANEKAQNLAVTVVEGASLVKYSEKVSKEKREAQLREKEGNNQKKE